MVGACHHQALENDVLLLLWWVLPAPAAHAEVTHNSWTPLSDKLRCESEQGPSTKPSGPALLVARFRTANGTIAN